MFVLVHGPGEHATTQIKLNLTNQRGNVLSYFSLINECIDTSEQRRHGVIHEIHLHLVFCTTWQLYRGAAVAAVAEAVTRSRPLASRLRTAIERGRSGSMHMITLAKGT